MIEKQELYSQIELIETGYVQLRKTTKIIENGEVISSAHHRSIVTPDDDISSLPQDIQDLCNTFWTDEVRQRFIDNKDPVA